MYSKRKSPECDARVDKSQFHCPSNDQFTYPRKTYDTEKTFKIVFRHKTCDGRRTTAFRRQPRAHFTLFYGGFFFFGKTNLFIKLFIKTLFLYISARFVVGVASRKLILKAIRLIRAIIATWPVKNDEKFYRDITAG